MSSVQVNAESALREAVAECARDPLRFVIMAYPWRRPGTPLEHFKGPDKWQVEHLRDLGERLRAKPHTTIREAIAAAHGVGKSADASWLLQWGMSTFPGCRAIATAGTLDQLRTKLIPEFAFWHSQLITRHWFDLHAESMHSIAPGHEKTWRLDFLPWNETRPEAFAGLHAAGRRIIFVVDEAAQVPQPIFDVIEGALSDARTERIFSIRSNTTRTDGPFFEAFHKHRARWITRHVDGRESELTDKEQIAEWIEAYGADSDFCRVRIAADWPRVGSMSFISRQAVNEAMSRTPVCHAWQPLLMGVDVARFGADKSVIAFRRGSDAATWPWARYSGVDTVTLANEVARLADQENVDAIFVDAVGVGAGVCDLLMRMHRQVFEVQAGAAPGGGFDLAMKCANRRAEMWALMKQAIDKDLALPDDDELEADLCNITYGYNASGALQMERKEDMRKRGLASTDLADALALTWAFPVAVRSDYTGVLQDERRRKEQDAYDPYSPDKL